MKRKITHSDQYVASTNGSGQNNHITPQTNKNLPSNTEISHPPIQNSAENAADGEKSKEAAPTSSESTRKSIRLKKRVHKFKYVKCHICKSDECRENLLKCKNTLCKEYFCMKCLFRSVPSCKSKKDLDDMRGKWDCLVCSHSCVCTTCQSSHDDDIDRLKKILQKEAAEYKDSKYIKKEILPDNTKTMSEGQVTEKYGVQILTKGKKKAYIIDNAQLSLEYISNHELANVTRLRNLYLNPKKMANKKEVCNACPKVPKGVTEVQKEEKAKNEESKPEQVVQNVGMYQYEQYPNPMMNGMFPAYPLAVPMGPNYNMLPGSAMPYNSRPPYFYPMPYGYGYPQYMGPMMSNMSPMQYPHNIDPASIQMRNPEEKK